MESPQKNQDVADADSNWDDYLLATKSEATPSEAFEHVECSLKSGFEVGMKLEIPNPEDSSTYWIASVVVICSELLTLRYLGDDRSGDFWIDTKTTELHPVGFCSSNSKKLYPPAALLEKHPDLYSACEKELKEIESVSALQDLQTSFMPIHQIKCGMKVEVSEYMDPNNLWIATIVQNVGGRLLLRYDGCDKSSTHDFWLFYLSDRVFPIGHSAENNIKYSVPKAIKELHTDKEWNHISKKSIEDHKSFSFPAHVLDKKIILDEHDFKEGMKLEAVNPQNYTQICPATVTKVLNQYYFLVAIDSFEMDESIESIVCCNSNSQLIFPVKWAEKNGVELTLPDGYTVVGSKFSWDVYLSFCKATPAPAELFNMCCTSTGLKLYQKLEAVDPFNRSNMYVATIERIVEPIMFLRFDADFKRTIVTGVNSLDIFPMGWCASNSYPLRIPVFRSKSKTSSTPPTSSTKCDKEKAVASEDKGPTSQTEQHKKSWCPKIYFNHRCFTGPLLSKGKLAELPKAIGPGAIHLVMNEVITRVVNVAYKSSRVLQILQVNGKPTQGMQQQVIKAKYKGKSHRATIEVVRNSGQVADFCKKICKKLECCPYLFGPMLIEENCPNNCSKQTKTKFGYHFVKKHKKPGRPPLSASTAAAAADTSTVESKTPESDDVADEPVKRGPGRRKKRRHWTQLLSDCLNKNENPPDDNESKDEDTENDSPPSPKPTTVPKKKIKHIPISSIVTRGAKLPNFGLWHHVSSFHSRRGRPRTRPLRPSFPPRKVGRPLGSTKKPVVVKKESEDDEDFVITDEEVVEVPPEPLRSVPVKKCTLKSNPVDWSIEDVARYIEKTECAPIVPLLKEQEIDGQALLMLNILDVQNYLNLRPEPANKFCGIVKNIKIEYYNFFCRNA